MMLIIIISILMAGGVLAWIAGYFKKQNAPWISLISLLISSGVALVFLFKNGHEILNRQNSNWLIDFRADWMPRFGISFHLGMDGLSFIMILLTLFLGILSVLTSWEEIKERVGFYYFNLLWILAGIIGVFTALDLFLFYFFWEVMLIPMYYLIGIWGHENRMYAAFKFFIFTQASGLLMLLSILGIYFIPRAIP